MLHNYRLNEIWSMLITHTLSGFAIFHSTKGSKGKCNNAFSFGRFWSLRSKLFEFNLLYPLSPIKISWSTK